MSDVVWPAVTMTALPNETSLQSVGSSIEHGPYQPHYHHQINLVCKLSFGYKIWNNFGGNCSNSAGPIERAV